MCSPTRSMGTGYRGKRSDHRGVWFVEELPMTVQIPRLRRGGWQDEVRGALDGLAYGARSALSPSVLHGAAVEIGWLTTHLAMYPLGLVGRTPALPARLNLAGLGPAQRGLLVSDVRAAGTPI